MNVAAGCFTAKLVRDDKIAGCRVELPFSPKDDFGKVRAAVRATLNGQTFRTTTYSVGGSYRIPLNRANRDAAGVSAGQSVTVTLAADDQLGGGKPPADFTRALRRCPRGTRSPEETR